MAPNHATVDRMAPQTLAARRELLNKKVFNNLNNFETFGTPNCALILRVIPAQCRLQLIGI